MTADAVQTTLTSRLGTAAAASTALGITVESAPTVKNAQQTMTMTAQQTSDNDDDTPALVGGVIGGLIGVGMCLFLAAWWAARNKYENQHPASTPVRLSRRESWSCLPRNRSCEPAGSTPVRRCGLSRVLSKLVCVKETSRIWPPGRGL